MKCAVILLLCASIAVAKPQQQRRRHSTPFIVGGEDSAKGRWPWQLSLQVTDDMGGFRHTCGAVLIHPRYVLCAAHCLMFADEAYPEDYEILAGAFNVAPGSSDAEQVIKIETWALHPEFSILESGLPADIALIKLVEDADLSNPNIAVVDLPSGNNDFAGSSECWITGWGRTSWDAEGSSPVLKELNIPVFTNQECGARWEQAPIIGLVHPILPVHICVGDDDGYLSACQGDSGGPMSCMEDGKFVVAGVTSRGWPDCEIFPSVYTRVAMYNSWINSLIGTL